MRLGKLYGLTSADREEREEYWTVNVLTVSVKISWEAEKQKCSLLTSIFSIVSLPETHLLFTGDLILFCVNIS